MNCPVIYLVVPCYNEEEMLPISAPRLLKKLNDLIESNKIARDSKILLVNDGSKDKTWDIIRNLHDEDARFSGINLSRNRGHQNALLAGLMVSKDLCDAAVSIDADLQDDIDAIDDMVAKFSNGFDIVLGVRVNRDSDSFFKRVTAQTFYKIMNIMGAQTVYNHADFRLMSKRALVGLSRFSEVNLYLRGIVPMVGYRTTTTEYTRKIRVAGESKYPFSKMIGLAFEGITSLSVVPLRLISYLGTGMFAIGIILGLYSLIQRFMAQTVSGWTSLMISLWAIGGLIMLSLGVVGEYIGKIYLETKQRPRYIIQEIIDDNFEHDSDGK